jgi:hypothetical protein
VVLGVDPALLCDALAREVCELDAVPDRLVLGRDAGRPPAVLGRRWAGRVTAGPPECRPMFALGL